MISELSMVNQYTIRDRRDAVKYERIRADERSRFESYSNVMRVYESNS